MERVEDIKEPLIKGKIYSVPCLVRYEDGKTYINPIINHPHNDKENGQDEAHYHIDYRFVKHENDSDFPTVVNNHSYHYFVESTRPRKLVNGSLRYFELPMINEDFTGITPVKNISKSKLKHKCIHKNKCPHRGFDLSQVKDIDGVITCPLHGLKFNSKNGKLINT